MAKASVTDRDRGWKATFKRLVRARPKSKTVLSVGIHSEKGAEGVEGGGDLTVAEVMAFHEFGLGVPRRSWLADWADENEELHKKQIRQMAKAVVAGKVKSVEIGFERLGLLYVGQIQKRIASGALGMAPYDPLSEETIKRKGSSIALVDTGQAKSAITYEVKTDGVEKTKDKNQG